MDEDEVKKQKKEDNCDFVEIQANLLEMFTREMGKSTDPAEIDAGNDAIRILSKFHVKFRETGTDWCGFHYALYVILGDQPAHKRVDNAWQQMTKVLSECLCQCDSVLGRLVILIAERHKLSLEQLAEDKKRHDRS